MNVVELNWNIALNLDYIDLSSLCQSSAQFRNICQDPIFWKQKYIRDFGIPQGFNINSVQDWNRMYQLQLRVFPKIRQFIFSLPKIRQQDTIAYINRAQTLISRDGPIMLRDEYSQSTVFTFDKVILGEVDITFNEHRRGISIMVHYIDVDRHIEYITAINTTSVGSDEPARITNSQGYPIEYYPELKELIYTDIIVDYEWKLDIDGLKYGNLYILNPDEILLFRI